MPYLPSGSFRKICMPKTYTHPPHPSHHSQYHHHATKKMTMSWLPYASSCQIKEKQLIKGIPILMRLM